MRKGDLVPMKPQVYIDPRPAEYFDRFHARARTQEPDWVYPLIKAVSSPYCRLLYRLRVQEIGRVPGQGPVILAPNHFSTMDHWFVGVLLPRPVRFMAKSQLFRNPFFEFVLSHAGAFPVRRGRHDEESMITATTILERAGVLVVYIEGGRSRSGQIGAKAKPGIGRLALQTGAPIVPVAIHGSERARNWKRLEFPAVTVRYGEPIQFGSDPEPSRERQQHVADETLARVRALHAELSASLAR
jgi:1-acyl-sn-glycerol-3-phosphate acyltransferase